MVTKPLSCAAPDWVHAAKLCDCDAKLWQRSLDADQPERPQRIGMGAGSYGRPAIDDILDSPRRYEK